jgi:excinuclease UvrABC nuclease subunit
MVTSRLGRGLFFGPFASRAAAERFEAGALDLFQVRRCEENLTPSPTHPGCIYGEMNRCLRPCQQVVSAADYRAEVELLERFLDTGGASIKETTEAARDRMSSEMRFEEAERLHQRLTGIGEVLALSGDLARSLNRLHGVAVTPSVEPEAIELWFLVGGRWQEARRLTLSETTSAGSSLDRRLRELAGAIVPTGAPNLEHLSILMRWHGSSWRDGEWIALDDLSKLPYRKLVNAMSRVGRATTPLPS